MSLPLVIGLACLDERFRDMLLLEGAVAVQKANLPVVLAEPDVCFLLSLKGDPEAAQALQMLGGKLAGLCKTPPCPNRLQLPPPAPPLPWPRSQA